MAVKKLKSFYLVGDTCLSLRYGHRKSIDLDLFSLSDLTNDDLLKILEDEKILFEYRNSNHPIALFGYINDVKIDFVKHFYFRQIAALKEIDSIRIFGDRDVMAMKIFAILKRAQKKDFWDVAELLEHHSLQEFIDAYSEKYPSHQLIISIPQALTYFSDADESEDPISLKGQTWGSVKKIIQRHVNDYLK